MTATCHSGAGFRRACELVIGGRCQCTIFTVSACALFSPRVLKHNSLHGDGHAGTHLLHS